MMAELRIYRRRLPHWRVDGAVYFVTWRLEREVPDLVLSALRHFDSSRCTLFACVVMNDHVHALLQPLPGVALEDLVRSWKSFTVNRMQKRGRVGRVWQPEYWDHIIRDQREFDEYLDYILTNPARRWPGVEGYPWIWLSPPEPA